MLPSAQKGMPPRGTPFSLLIPVQSLVTQWTTSRSQPS
jgi:hypothetical protein